MARWSGSSWMRTTRRSGATWATTSWRSLPAPAFGGTPAPGYGLLISTGPDTFVGAGYGFRVAFRPTTPGPAQVGLGAVDEGQYTDGRWIAGRRLNGDERQGWVFPPAELPASPLPIPLRGAGTGIARCVVYRYG